MSKLAKSIAMWFLIVFVAFALLFGITDFLGGNLTSDTLSIPALIALFLYMVKMNNTIQNIEKRLGKAINDSENGIRRSMYKLEKEMTKEISITKQELTKEIYDIKLKLSEHSAWHKAK